jgi:DNA-binding NtrC family response regulator
MPNIHIFHLEDDSLLRKVLETVAKYEGLTYNGGANLESLKIFLLKNNADMYIIDNKVPADESSGPESKAIESIAMIRKMYEHAKIIIYAGDDGKLEKLAKENNVDFFNKNISAVHIINYVKNQLKGIPCIKKKDSQDN